MLVKIFNIPVRHGTIGDGIQCYLGEVLGWVDDSVGPKSEVGQETWICDGDASANRSH